MNLFERTALAVGATVFGVFVGWSLSVPRCPDANAAYTRGEAAGIRSTTAMFEEVMRK